MITLYSILIVAVIVWLAPTVIFVFALACLVGKLYRTFLSRKEIDYPILAKLENAVIAHRAAAKANAKDPSCRAPENTLEAFDAARNVHGVYSVEFDVRCTLDGIPVVFHDEVLGKTLNVSPEDGIKGVQHFSYNQIKKMRFRAEHVGNGSLHSYVPTFEEAVVRCKTLGLNMMIELKPGISDRNSKTIVDIITRHSVEHSCYVASFDPLLLYRIRKHGKGTICTGFLFAASTVDLLLAEFQRQDKQVSPVLHRVVSFPFAKQLIDGFFHLLGSPFMLHLLGHRVAAAQYTYLSPYHVLKYRSAGITVLGWTFQEDSEHIQRTYFTEARISLITDFPLTDLIAISSDNPTSEHTHAPAAAKKLD